MAEHVERIEEGEAFEFVGFRLSWGAIFAGFVIALVTQVILTLIGLAVGLGSLQFGPDGTLEQVGIGAGIWAVVTGLISLFVGGLAAGHFAGILTRLDGVLHGVLVWGLTVIVALWALTSGVSTLLGGCSACGPDGCGGAGGAGRLGAAVVQEGGVSQILEGDSREQIVAVLEQQGMSRSQAQQAAQRIQETQRQVQLQAEEVRRRAPQVADQVAGTVSSAIWWILLATVLSLAAAASGAAITARLTAPVRRRRPIRYRTGAGSGMGAERRSASSRATSRESRMRGPRGPLAVSTMRVASRAGAGRVRRRRTVWIFLRG